MRGGMAGLVVHDKENTPGRGDGKKERERRRSGGRRLSINGSNSHAHYLRAIANRFKKQGGAGRGRILVHRPLHFDGSPFEFDSRSDGEKRRSFVVYEDVVDSVRFKPKELATDLETTGKSSLAARSKNATLGECRTLVPRGIGEQAASVVSAQQKSKCYALESIVAFQARAKAMFTAISRAPPEVPLVEAPNEQEFGLRTPLVIQPRRWQRGGGGRVYSQCSLDTSEIEDIEQLFREMDKEDLEEELHRHELDMEMHKYDLTEEMREHRECEELLVSAEVSETYETGKDHVEEQANVCELPPEQFNCYYRGLSSPRVDGLEIEDETANVELTTPQLRVDQEPVPKPSPVILELGVSPESNDADRAIKQLTPAGHKYSGCKNQDLDSPQQIPEEVESQLEQTVNNVLVWSVELDPSRRRREIMDDYRNWRTPRLEKLVHSSFGSAAQVPRSASDELKKPAQLNVSMSLASFSSSQLDLNGPAKNLAEAYEREFLSTSLPRSGKDQSGQAEGVQILDGEFLTCPDQATANEDEMHIALKENEREMQTWRDSKAIVSSSLSSWPDQSPVRAIDLFAQCMGSLHEKSSESSLESPSSHAAELLRRVESATATPLLQASFDTIGMSPTPPRDLRLYLGNPFGKMSGEDLSRRWLQFCTSPSVFSDVIARSKKSWKVESTFTEATSLAPTTSFPSEQLLQRTAEAYVQPNTEEEAVSSDGLDWKTVTHDEEEVLLNAGEEAVSSDGLDWKTVTHDEEEVLLNAGEEAVSSDGLDWKTVTHDEEVLLNAGEEAVSSDGLDWKTVTHDEEVLLNAGEEAVSSDGLGWKTVTHDAEVLLNAGEEAASSDGSDGVMDYENDIDDISNATTQIIQTGASSAYNDQEGTSALKECPQEDVPLDEDVLSLSLTPLKDNNPMAAIIDPAVEFSLTHLEEEHIDQFVSSLQVTPVADESRMGKLNINGEDVSKGNHNGNSPDGKDGHLSSIKERITPGKDANQSVTQSQDECTPVRKQSKTKRSRKSTKTKKVDSPLDAGSKWSNGKRQSTRIKSKPLDWWRGERMLYGRVHSSLNTLIGIKHLSPDPVWPRPRTGDRKNKVAPQKFKVDSFVSDEHNELLRLAAQ